MSVKPEISIINARVLPTPKISYHNASQDAEFGPQEGAWSLKGKRLAQGATLGSWSVVNFGGNIPKPAIERFIRELCQAFADKGSMSLIVPHQLLMATLKAILIVFSRNPG